MPLLELKLSGTLETEEGEQRELQPPEALRILGPVSQAILAFPDAVQREMQKSGQEPRTAQGMVMFDTGAGTTFIDNEVAQRLGLPTVGFGYMTSASEADVRTPAYSAKLVIPNLNINLEAALGANLAPHNIIALIGRDVLERGILIYNGFSGSFSFAI